MNLLKVDGHTNLVRDEQTNAILNVNMTEYQSYQEQKKIKEQEKQRIEDLEHDLNSMKNDLGEIKDLLRSMINGSK